MKKLKLIALLITMLTIGHEVFAQQVEQGNLPVRGVGVVVKKNPGGPAFTSNTSASGDQEVTITEQGDYTFTLANTKPKTATGSTKPTIKRMEVQGGPVIGVKVGLGKNPSGVIVATGTTNVNGEVVFTNVAVGTYKLVILPDDKVKSEPVRQSRN